MARRDLRRRLQRVARDAGVPDAAVPPRPMEPDARSQPPLRLVELPSGPEDAERCGFPALTYFRRYLLGECSVLVTRTPEYGWHLSIAHHARYPAWDEQAQARYRLLPDDIWMAQYLPPSNMYTNIHRFCFQWMQCSPPRDRGG